MNTKTIFRLLVQLAVLILFYILGSGISFWLGGYVPGSVIGMVLLFMCLNLGWVKASHVDKISELLLGNIVLFFLPVTVGLMTVAMLIEENIWTILISVLLSTFAVIATVGIIAQKLENSSKIRAWQRAVFRILFFYKKDKTVY